MIVSRFAARTQRDGSAQRREIRDPRMEVTPERRGVAAALHGPATIRPYQ